MMGSFVTRALVLVLGYAYPAYECFKAVELNKPEVEQLIFWCQYWILVAALTVFERVGESFISWVPMYNEAKLASFVYLWYPKTKGTTYVYETFFRPYVAKHENEIDRNLLELRTRAGDIVALYWQKTASYGQTRLFEVLQYIASQSPSQSSRSHPVQGLGRGMDLVFLDDIINCLVEVRSARPGQQVQLPKAEIQQLCVVSWDIFLSQPNLPGLESPRSSQCQQPRQIRRMASTTAARQQTVSQEHQQQTCAPSNPTKRQLQEPAPLVAQPPASPALTSLPSSEVTALPTPAGDGEAMQVEVANAASKEDTNPPSQETPMEEAIRMTRGRLRKRAATAGPSIR